MRFVQKLAAFGAAGLLVGCNGGDGDNYRAYIAPLDGQTAVATDLPLFVEIGDISMPPDLPIPEDFIRVVDLVDGGTVAGELVRDDTRVYFEPSEPWSENGRYAWSVLPLERHPHGPQFQFPAHLLGTAVFDTRDTLELLATGFDVLENRTCMIFSRKLTASDTGSIAVTVNDVAIDDAIVQILEAGDWGMAYAIDSDDDDVSVACLTTASPIQVGARVRVWMSGLGPWTSFLEEKTSSEMMISLRRANY